MLVKLCLREVDVLEILLAIDDKRHGDDGNSQSFRLGLRDAAVGIGDDLYHCHDRFLQFFVFVHFVTHSL